MAKPKVTTINRVNVDFSAVSNPSSKDSPDTVDIETFDVNNNHLVTLRMYPDAARALASEILASTRRTN